MSWRVSSTVVNVSPSTRPSPLRDSLVCVLFMSFRYVRLRLSLVFLLSLMIILLLMVCECIGKVE